MEYDLLCRLSKYQSRKRSDEQMKIPNTIPPFQSTNPEKAAITTRYGKATLQICGMIFGIDIIERMISPLAKINIDLMA